MGAAEIGGIARIERTGVPVGARRFEVVFAAWVVVLALLSGVAIWFDWQVTSGGLDIVINTLTALAAAGAAGLAWIRYAEFGEHHAVVEASAFVVLLATRGMLVLLAVVGLAGGLGLSLDAPQQWPLYAWSLARGLTAVLLIIAALQALERLGPARLSAAGTVILPSVLVIAVIVLLPLIEDSLPPLIGAEGVAALRGDPGAGQGMTGLGLAAQAAIAALYLWGAGLHLRLRQRTGSRYAGFLAIALLVAAFSQLHWAISPGIYAPIVTTDDFLRAAFSLILLAGIQVQLRADVGELRRANIRLEELRAVEVERVALETRAQLAREVHDGLAQELWLAKLKSGRLAGLDGLPDDARGLAGEVAGAVDRALGESRVALTSIRAGLDGELPLGGSLEAYVQDFGDRSGLEARFEAEPNLPPLSPRVSAEVLRIVVESLANVAKHAGASSVEVRMRQVGATLEVAVIDNGSGFDVDSIDRTRYGIRGMRERAAVVGGGLDIRSADGEGTTVILSVPIEDAAEIRGR